MILSTRGMVAVPQASAATACAPPIVKARLTPATAAAASTRSLRSPTAAAVLAPSRPPVATLPRTGVGTTITISPTPATRAGIAFISTLDG